MGRKYLMRMAVEEGCLCEEKTENEELLSGPGNWEHANHEEIKMAFRKMASRCHPDHNPQNIRGTEEKFKEIAQAYQILGDEFKRRH
jgi:hypothetical protein